MSTYDPYNQVPLYVIVDPDRTVLLKVYPPEGSGIRVVNPMRVTLSIPLQLALTAEMHLADYDGETTAPSKRGCPVCAHALSLLPDLSERVN